MNKNSHTSVKGDTGFKLRKSAISVAVISALTTPAFAQDLDKTLDEVVVTGYRKSLEDAMDYKRNNDGVVDAINATDIGKFPNTNLAEALQRIPGVSINRVNGEGSQVTVRGFGGNFNQVTLNGRSLPTADIAEVGSGTDGQNVGGSGRAFDFSNLASDGVRALEVYKTGRADIASGGIGATINVKTARPLDNPGVQAAVSVKAIADTSVDRGSDVTPEIGGNFSWSNDEGTFGVGLFGSISERNSAAPSATSASWNVLTFDNFLSLTTPNTVLRNAPTDGNALVTLPRDSRYHFSEFESDRINGQLVMQFQPTENLRLTADYTFAENEVSERRSDVSNWFNRPFTEVIFDDSPVQSTVFLSENSTNQGAATQQTLRATKDELDSFGFNAAFDVSDSLSISFDAHTSEASVTPNAPGNYSRINVGLDQKYSPGVGTINQSVDYRGDIPLQIIQLAPGNTGSLADLSVDTSRSATQVANLRRDSQINEIDQVDLHANWEINDTSSLTVGANYRSQTNMTDRSGFRQILGNWGAENPGDVEQFLGANGLEEFCLSCRFNDFTISGATLDRNQLNTEVNTVRGNAEDIFFAASAQYDAGFNGAPNRPLNQNSNAVDEISEDVISLYVQYGTEFSIADRPATLNVGLRYEETDVTSITSSLPTAFVEWQGNNDFATVASSEADGFRIESKYDNFLPNIDLGVDLTDDLKIRASYSTTIARATYNNLFASASVSAQNGPTALAGNQASANSGNPELLPLESDNIDLSLEWYFGDSSYVSAGFFDKNVQNFVGRETINRNLFGLRDVSSGAAGSRSGDGLGILNALGAEVNEDNLFAATYYVENLDSVAAAQARFAANRGSDGNILPAVYDAIELAAGSNPIRPDGNDPLLNIAVNQPVNNRDAGIDGFEFQGQHFFGDSGFGIAASYTLVNGDVEFNVAGDPSVSQFALPGLSDTANLTLIYEKEGLSARLAYNWRDEFLASSNDGSGFNNPIFVEEYAQLDLSIGYEVNDQLSLSFAGINLTEESSRSFARSRSDLLFLRENAARFYVGASYKF